MLYRKMAAAALSLALMGGAAYAQQAPKIQGNVDPSAKEGNMSDTTASIDRREWTSDAERTWYEENRERIAGFFTDESMMEMRSDAEVREIFAAMGAEDQSEIKAACDRIENDRGSYGQVTHTLCMQVGEGG